MGKSYEDLSRRALIQLGHDYDIDNEAALLRYLEAHPNYEGIRPVERVVERADQIVSSVKGAGGVIKAVIANQADKLVDKIIDSVQNCIHQEESERQMAEAIEKELTIDEETT